MYPGSSADVNQSRIYSQLYRHTLAQPTHQRGHPDSAFLISNPAFNGQLEYCV